MKYNFESIKLVNENERLTKKIKEGKKFKNRIKKIIKKVVNR